ncbi:hypothetical protein C2138_03220 [Salinibacterium hongtaonis]|nr:hypothetical protein C2138_03220 [Salinibacterium hongtaonis]
MGGEPHADVGDERGGAGRPALDEVEHISAVHHAEVPAVPLTGNEGAHGPLADAGQGLLVGEGGTDLERREAEGVAVSLFEVNEKTLVDEDSEQLVGGGSRQPQFLDDE